MFFDFGQEPEEHDQSEEEVEEKEESKEEPSSSFAAGVASRALLSSASFPFDLKWAQTGSVVTLASSSVSPCTLIAAFDLVT